jgi:hypothetical protein
LSQDSLTRQFWQTPRFQRRAAITFLVAAPICAFAIPGAGALTLPVAFILIGILLWQKSRPVKLSLDEEISQSLKQWMSKVPDGREMAPLREAFQDHFQGIKLLDEDPAEGARRLRVAQISFENFLEENHDKGTSGKGSLSGLAATATFHRAKTAYHLALLSTDLPAQLRQLRSVLHDLEGFEKEHQQWQMLTLPAIALRIDIHVRLSELDEAEAEQEILDAHAIGVNREPEIIATRRVIADAMWEAASTHVNDEIASGLRFRALIHYDDWLNQVNEDELVARLIVAQRNSEIEQGERVIALLSDVVDDHGFVESAGKRGLLEANRLLARAYLQAKDFDRALRFYSVLMSVGGDANPYLHDTQVLREIRIAEEKNDEEQF